MEKSPRRRALIFGVGFAGLTIAMELEKKFGHDPSVEVTLVNRENFFLFTPMLHEVAASDLDLTTIPSCLRVDAGPDLFKGRCSVFGHRRAMVSHREADPSKQSKTVAAP